MTPPVLILYGSETGTAADVAASLCYSCRCLGIPTMLASCDDAIDLLSEASTSPRLLCLVLATCGAGDPPANTLRFWRSVMRRSTPPQLFTGTRVACLGLGDSAYQKYNYAAKKMARRLLQLGATDAVPLALADESHPRGQQVVVGPFTEEFLRVACDFAAVSFDAHRAATHLLPPVHLLTQLESGSDRHGATPEVMSGEGCVDARVISNVRQTSEDHFQDVRLLTLTSPGLAFSPGDVAYVQPRNSPDTILATLSTLSLSPDDVYTATDSDTGTTMTASLAWFAEHYWDVTRVPQRGFFAMLARLSPDEVERERLVVFLTVDGEEDLFAYCYRARRSILEVLRDFPATLTALTLPYLFDLIPSIQSRPFSIAGGAGDEIELLVAVVQYQTVIKTPRRGLCSNFIASLRAGDDVSVRLRAGILKFPANGRPVVLVGPGTGLAVCRAYAQMLARQRGVGDGESAGAWLFFGCRYSAKDFLCADNLLSWRDDGCLRLSVAFSRDSDTKRYVQHEIADSAVDLWRWLSQRGAYIVVSGNAKQMPASVREAFVEVVRVGSGGGEEEAEKFVAELERVGRYQVEVWS